MRYSFPHITVSKLAIIGAGQIGPDIALHFSKVFSEYDVPIVLVDIEAKALERAREKMTRKIEKGVESGAFTADRAEAMRAAVTYTLDYQAMAGSDIVLEAATEDEGIKEAIFKRVEAICDEHCLFFSNSSHIQPEVIFKNIRRKSRCLVTHYFFPAERNPVVEIVPSGDTDRGLVRDVLGFYESIGKVPVEVGSSYGYAIDPIFEGLCQTALLCLEQGYGTVKEIDRVAVETLGLGVGPFTALNLTGGNPITDHGLDEMHRRLMPWFRSPACLKEGVKNGRLWPVASRDEEIGVPADRRDRLAARFMGAYFGLASFILDRGLCDAGSLDMACEIALVVRPPFTLMNEIGLDRALSLVRAFCKEEEGFAVPRSLERAAEEGKWKISHVLKRVEEDVAVLTIRRPRVLNALNRDVMNELQAHFEETERDASLVGSVLTGFGVKAFVSGADLHELAAYRTPEEGYRACRRFKRVLDYMERASKPIVCALNGFALGGGNELAMACTTRICRKRLPVVACQPEVNLGFIPGAGGTQRLPRLVGLEKGAAMLRTARAVSSAEAVEMGLVYREAEGALIPEAVALVRQLHEGRVRIPPLRRTPLEDVGEWAPVDIGHRSRRIDGILVRAIRDGAHMTLEEGLELESRLFGECLETEDMKIGIDNFMKNGPGVKATFVHR